MSIYADPSHRHGPITAISTKPIANRNTSGAGDQSVAARAAAAGHPIPKLGAPPKPTKGQ